MAYCVKYYCKLLILFAQITYDNTGVVYTVSSDDSNQSLNTANSGITNGVSWITDSGLCKPKTEKTPVSMPSRKRVQPQSKSIF